MFGTAIGNALVSGFPRDCSAVMRGFFKPWIEGTREQNIASPGFHERTYRPDDGSAPFFRADPGLAHEHRAPSGGSGFPLFWPVEQRPAG